MAPLTSLSLQPLTSAGDGDFFLLSISSRSSPLTSPGDGDGARERKDERARLVDSARLRASKQLVAAAQVSEARIDATSRYFEIVAEPLKQVTVSLSTHSARTRAPGVVSM